MKNTFQERTRHLARFMTTQRMFTASVQKIIQIVQLRNADVWPTNQLYPK